MKRTYGLSQKNNEDWSLPNLNYKNLVLSEEEGVLAYCKVKGDGTHDTLYLGYGRTKVKSKHPQ